MGQTCISFSEYLGKNYSAGEVQDSICNIEYVAGACYLGVLAAATTVAAVVLEKGIKYFKNSTEAEEAEPQAEAGGVVKGNVADDIPPTGESTLIDVSLGRHGRPFMLSKNRVEIDTEIKDLQVVLQKDHDENRKIESINTISNSFWKAIVMIGYRLLKFISCGFFDKRHIVTFAEAKGEYKVREQKRI